MFKQLITGVGGKLKKTWVHKPSEICYGKLEGPAEAVLCHKAYLEFIVLSAVLTKIMTSPEKP